MKKKKEPTELKAGENVLVKHTCTKDRLTSYWENNLFTVAEGNALEIIV